MKKLCLLLIALVAFSCSDDDDATTNGIENPYTGDVLGLWGTRNVWVDGDQMNLDCDAAVTFEDNYLFNFLENGTFTVEQQCSDAPFLESGTYTTTGNVLTLNLNGMEGKAHMIDDIANNRLYWRFNIGSSGLFYGYEIEVMRMLN